VRSDSDLHQASDLNSKVMGGDTPSEISVVATRIWMDRHGGDGKSLRALGLPVSELLPALVQGASIPPCYGRRS